MRREEIPEMKGCRYKEACPYLNFEPAARVLAQRDYLSNNLKGRVPRALPVGECSFLNAGIRAYLEE